MPLQRIKGLRLMFLGAPGVGKGTYAQRLVQQTAMPYFSSGDLLRREVASGTELGKSIKTKMDAGQFVEDHIVEGMVLREVQTASAAPSRGFLLDGYPRNLEQARRLEERGLPIDYVVNLRQPQEVIVAKLASRRVCPTCGFNYNYANIKVGAIVMEPLVPQKEKVCDKCGYEGDLHTRDDDHEHIIRSRLEKYERDTRPLEDFYGERGMLVHFDVHGGAKKYLPVLVDQLAALQPRS